MGADGNSQLVAMWDAAVAAITNTFDAYGWIVPAVLISVLLIALLGLVGYLTEDLPFDADVFNVFPAIFKWMRESWQGNNYEFTREERSRLTLLRLQ
jgi:hypothetical protein